MSLVFLQNDKLNTRSLHITYFMNILNKYLKTFIGFACIIYLNAKQNDKNKKSLKYKYAKIVTELYIKKAYDE